MTHRGIFVLPGDPIPAANVGVDPRQLAQIAYDSMDLLTGTIEWNPKLNGSGSALVNAETSIWAADAPSTASVTASIPGTSATVTANVTGITVTSQTGDVATCPDGQPPVGDAGFVRDQVRAIDREPARQGRSDPADRDRHGDGDLDGHLGCRCRGSADRAARAARRVLGRDPDRGDPEHRHALRSVSPRGRPCR